MFKKADKGGSITISTLCDKLARRCLKPHCQLTWLRTNPKGSYKCHQSNHCVNVIWFCKPKSFMILYLKKKITINQLNNSKTTCVINRLECCVCKVFCVGKDQRWLQGWLAEHKYAICTGNLNYPIERHCMKHHNSNPSKVQVCGIYHKPAVS